MSRTPTTAMLLLAVLLVGCASGPKPEPSMPADASSESRGADELLAKGRQSEARGDAVRAEQYLSLAIERGADRRVVMPILLRACLKSSHLRAALNHAEPYLLDHPEDDALRYLVATVHLAIGQEPAARRELGLLLQRNEANADAHYLLGLMDAVTNIAKAREHFLLALQNSKDPEQQTELRSRLAELSLRERQWLEARSGEKTGDVP